MKPVSKTQQRKKLLQNRNNTKAPEFNYSGALIFWRFVMFWSLRIYATSSDGTWLPIPFGTRKITPGVTTTYRYDEEANDGTQIYHNNDER